MQNIDRMKKRLGEKTYVTIELRHTKKKIVDNEGGKIRKSKNKRGKKDSISTTNSPKKRNHSPRPLCAIERIQMHLTVPRGVEVRHPLFPFLLAVLPGEGSRYLSRIPDSKTTPAIE